MAKLYNLARMTTTTTGTGTITLGSAVAGYLTFAQSGVADGDVVDYAIKDGNDSEIGTGTYTSSGTTLTRTVTKSTNSDAALNLSGAAEVFITPRAETLNDGLVSYTSADLTMSSAGSFTLAHGLGAIPKFVNLYLKCTSAENGYSVGDIVVAVTPTYVYPSIIGDGTNISIRLGVDGGTGSVFRVAGKTDGASSLANISKWKLIVKAYA